MKSLWPFFLIVLVLLSGCNSEKEVKVQTGGVRAPTLFELEGRDIANKNIELPDHILSNDPLPMLVRIHNDTQYPYTELDLAISVDGSFAPATTFTSNPIGEMAYPGYEGTCGRTLGPGMTCEIRLSFTPRESRTYNEILTLKFKNYVDSEVHVGKFTIIAGTPASLVFTNDVTQYTFGTLVGLANTPVVEREDAGTYTQELEVINAGGLPARNLVVTHTEGCTSVLTNTCPAGMNEVFTVQSSCPKRLNPGEKCKAQVIFKPKNQDLVPGPTPDEIKEINYRSTVSYDFVRDPTGATGSLNGHFKSVSTNIEARFKVSISTISFETPVISGNRDQRTVRVNNLGYREGEIKGIALRDSGGTLIATCLKIDGTTVLECRNAGNSIVGLDILPFTLKDKDNCLNSGSGSPVLVPVGSGCLFDLVFQPSVTFDTDKSTEFQNLQPEVIYDSRWRGAETIVTKKLFNLSAKSIAAAKIVLDKIVYDGITYTLTGTGPWEANLGRLALQSPSFFKRKPMTITFKNIGSSEATNISIKDGSNSTIPIGGTGANLGTLNPKYYHSAIASDSTCTVIAPNNSCTITTLFAPIGLTTNAEEDSNMFDATDGLGEKYKGFRLSYSSGALFTDTNRIDPTDYPTQQAEARMKATLIRKGLLMQLADDTRNVSGIGSNVAVVGDTQISHIYLQNIGTGTIPYIRLLNPPMPISPSNNFDVSIIPTTDPSALGVDHDCLNILDVDTTYTVPVNALPSARLGNFNGLPKDESCAFTVRMKTHNRIKSANAVSCTNTLAAANAFEEGIRFFNREVQAANTAELWEYCSTNVGNINWNNIQVRYYDGDASNPALSPPSAYGTSFTLNNYNYNAFQAWPAKLLPYGPTPALTATIYRPNFTIPTLSGTQTTKSYVEAWFYGLSTSFYVLRNDPGQISTLIQGDESRDFVPSLSAYSNRASYDYIYYLGSFPQSSPNVAFPLNIRNFGSYKARVTSITTAPDPAFTTTSFPSTIPFTINPNIDISPLNFSFNTSTPGEHHMVFEYSYETGNHLDDLTYFSSNVASNAATSAKKIITQKILVVGYVIPTGTYPQLTATVEDYDVAQNDGAPPTVTLNPGTSATLSWNSTAPTTTLLFDSIKLTTTPTVNDVYAQKRITFTNNTGYTINDFKYVFRTDTNTTSSKNLPTSFKTIAGTTCTSGMVLAPSESCQVVIKYQPISGDVTDLFVMSMVYQLGTGQYGSQNLGISLFPRAPGALIASGITLESINYKVTAGSGTTTRSSYPLNFGTTTLNVSPKTMSFSTTATAPLTRTRFLNTEATKASLLLSYHRYLTNNSLRGYSPGSPAPSSVVPAVGEYRNVSGLDYAIIHVNKYADNSDRVVVEASKGCLFGDDENDAMVPAFKKGFNNATTTPCYIIITINLNFDYLMKSIAINNGDDMRENAVELWYYSVNRSSTASTWMHVKGAVNPDTSIATGNYGSVNSYENRTTDFTLPRLDPTTAGVGSIVGLRVLRAPSSATLSSPYSTGITTYVDIKPYNPAAIQTALFTTGLLNSNYYYYRVVAIRYDARFTKTGRFVGLPVGEYLSATTNLTTPFKILVPPTNHYYFHDQKLIIEKSLHAGVTYDRYSDASTRCTGRAAVVLKDPANVNRTYQMINSSAWTLLKATPAATSYNNMTQVSHWITDPTVSITTMCSALPGYTANTASQVLTSSSVFYIRNGSNPNANVNISVGGVPGTSASNYTSYVDGSIQFASARCMATLP